MKVLVACERFGKVRDAFIARGHDAVSCDLKPTKKPGPHYEGNVFDIIKSGWDLLIAHPECTYLTVSGNKWMSPKQHEMFPEYADRPFERLEAAEFFMRMAEADRLYGIPKVAVENPIGVMSTFYRQPDQIIHPWQFGHGETKATCLWLKNLPPLIPTKIVTGREARIFNMPPADDRKEKRSETYDGWAEAMADQWGEL